MAENVPCCETEFIMYVLICIGLVTFAGLMAGLTLGLMSLGLVDLEVLMKAGRPQDRNHAAKIFPVVKNQHLLLCTLLIGNSLAMEALPVFLDRLVSPWVAIALSVTLILIFGEIMPQAVCTRYGLSVGAALAPFVRVLLWMFLPVSYPISKVLDWMLGKEHAVLLRRAELKTFVDFHGNEAGRGGDLTHDETTIIAGALELTEKTAKDAMTPISNAFSLDLDATLNLETLNAIMTTGHSRVPVYAGTPKNTIGLILVKNLLAVDPEDAVTLRTMIIRKIPRVAEGMPLYDILNEFQKGHSHLAVVYRDLDDKNETPKATRGVEVLKDNCKKHKAKSKKSFRKGNDVGSVTATSDKRAKLESNDAHKAISKKDEDQQMKNSPSQIPAFNKRHRGCSYCILDIENNPIPEFPPNEEVVGVLTMEDVIEELLKEEILDETDEYVNIHNRIKVNMHASQGKVSGLSLPLTSPKGSTFISSLKSASQLSASSVPAPNPLHSPVTGSSTTT